MGSGKVRITIIYDNEVFKEGLAASWGFSCLVEIENTPKILFDTGADGAMLLSNMKKLNIDPESISAVFISHSHWDHTGGLSDFLKINRDVKLYVPASFPCAFDVEEVIPVKASLTLYEGVFSTGELSEVEQSMVVKLDGKAAVIAGCSHPGVGNIIRAASQFGKVSALIGGLHGFKDFDLVKDMDLICATHCTEYKPEIKDLYPGKFVEGGAGKVIEL